MGSFLVCDVDDLTFYEHLEIWLASFFPVHTICCRGFQKALAKRPDRPRKCS